MTTGPGSEHGQGGDVPEVGAEVAELRGELVLPWVAEQAVAASLAG